MRAPCWSRPARRRTPCASRSAGTRRRLTTQLTRHSVGAWSYLVCAGSLIAFPAYVYLLKHSTPARVSTYAYVNPVVAVFLGWLILHEPVSTRTLVASAVIVVAVAIITTQRAKART